MMSRGLQPRTDHFPPELMRLLSAARRELDHHLNDHGHCVACGFDWPCERATQAAFALEII